LIKKVLFYFTLESRFNNTLTFSTSLGIEEDNHKHLAQRILLVNHFVRLRNKKNAFDLKARTENLFSIEFFTTISSLCGRFSLVNCLRLNKIVRITMSFHSKLTFSCSELIHVFTNNKKIKKICAHELRPISRCVHRPTAKIQLLDT
jgi:hypothetical protein